MSEKVKTHKNETTKLMENQAILDPPDYDSESAYIAYSSATTPEFSQIHFWDFVLRQRYQFEFRRLSPTAFLSKSWRSRSSYQLQMVHAIHAVAASPQVEPDWLNLHGNWMAIKKYVIFSAFSIYVPQRDGDGINPHGVEPSDIE